MSSMLSGSKNNSGEHENVVDQLVNLYPRWPRVKTSSTWDSCSMMISARFTDNGTSTCYIIMHILLFFFFCRRSHLSNKQQRVKHFCEVSEAILYPCSHPPRKGNWVRNACEMRFARSEKLDVRRGWRTNISRRNPIMDLGRHFDWDFFHFLH